MPNLAASREPDTMRRSLDLVSPDQDSNPLELMCTCKGFPHHCICSHVLAVSHLLKGIDLKKELQELSKRREAHRPRDARGARQIQPEDGVSGAAEGEAGEQDCEMD